MRNVFFATLILSTAVLLSACGQSTETALNTTQSNSHTQSSPGKTNANQAQNPPVTPTTQSNIELAEDPTAAQTIKQFYQDLNEQKYSEATTFLGPQLHFEGTPANIKYLKNMKKTTFIKFEDISNDSGSIDPSESQYYKIKVYYAEINIEVQDPDLVPTLPGTNYRKIIVIKKTEKSPWLIDIDEDVPERK